MELSVMFFGADDASAAGHAAKYDDIMAITRAADRLGFTAVWTPERHFQQVGQVFPNPALLSAALATATERIHVRAGSLVLPLHHPLRVAEDWAVVDNLSRGRVGVSVATGWHSKDFVLAPGAFEGRREQAFRDLGLLRRLWAGEAVEFTDGAGERVAVTSQPRPYSPALPLWTTTSGSPQTWEAAGGLRTNILGATIGQTREELAGKIERYREAYTAAPEQPGAPPRGTVTLMAHTYTGTSDEQARELAGGPLKAYLRSYVAQTAANKGADGRAAALSEAQLGTLTDFAFQRYLNWGSLIGSPETCRKNLADLADLGCDEVACFVDFGLGVDEVLAGLERLADLREGM
ncbi:natural product biosynthesis luciferase-like monooxygenase domain-containing protein [Nonomuraea solani]|uniref:Natural product biosynthesis luciferase-like monooxygenase domain-containing protein n=1 Tax=Nonomuraea solani TaxID=1144553 RepID=A0A1H6ESY6_9ACTN|nr:MupA/Atu3671 family FMN-dependent luciferase-like monooxygenase [Nonomuraea solani]SEH00065.1 natural product biosynthesis luciferase-like monooxygenase domain-containing protein [Nonomuraea solani]